LSSFILNSPIVLMYIFFAPFPWQVFKASQLFAAMEMLIWYVLVIFAIRGFFISMRYKLKESSPILVFLVIMIFVLFVEGNVGALFRHRYVIWPVLHIMISVGLFYRSEKHKLIS